MTPFVYRSTLALLLISLFLSLAILWKQETHKRATPRVESKYQTLPHAPTMSMKHDNSNGTHMMEMNKSNHAEMEMQKKLESKISFGEDALTITNGDTVDWTECTLEMNETVVRDGYMYEQDSFPSQKKITIPYSKFVRDGVAFDASVSHPNNVMLMCMAGNMMGWNLFSNR